MTNSLCLVYFVEGPVEGHASHPHVLLPDQPQVAGRVQALMSRP